MIGWKRQAVGPIRSMRHQAAASRASNEWPQQSDRFNVAILLEVAERSGVLIPIVKAKHRFAQSWHRFEQGLVERHVEGVVARAAFEKIPGVNRRSHRGKDAIPGVPFLLIATNETVEAALAALPGA